MNDNPKPSPHPIFPPVGDRLRLIDTREARDARDKEREEEWTKATKQKDSRHWQKLRKGEAGNQFVTAREFPLELVAVVAARLHVAGQGYAETADAALRLLDACAARLLNNQRLHKQEEEFAREIEKLGLAAGDHFPQAMVFKLITGQNRPDRAEEDHLGFLEYQAPKDADAKKRSIQDRLFKIKTIGLCADEIWVRKAQFDAWRASGDGKRKRPKKKSLPSKNTSTLARKPEASAGKRRNPAK